MTLQDPALFDPQADRNISFKQSRRIRAACKVVIAGVDVTSKLEPFLISLRVVCGVWLEDYNCEIEVDDRDGRLPIPAIGALVEVSLGWQNEAMGIVFNGVVHDVEHGFGRKQGGRRMWIHAFGSSMLGHGKSPMNNHWGDGDYEGGDQGGGGGGDQGGGGGGQGTGTGSGGSGIPLHTPLQDAAKAAGLSIQVNPIFQGVMDKYWAQTGESFYHFARRHAESFNGLFRVTGGTNGEFTVKGQKADGSPQPTITAKWGDNLIGWRVRPMAARPAWHGVNQQFYDKAKGIWSMVGAKTGLSEPWSFAQSIFQLPTPAPNQGQGGQEAGGAADVSGTEQGPGRIVIQGEPIDGGCFVELVGARPGVDGTYWAQTVEHIYSRQGYVTWLDVHAHRIAGQGSTGGVPAPGTPGNEPGTGTPPEAPPFTLAPGANAPTTPNPPGRGPTS